MMQSPKHDGVENARFPGEQWLLWEDCAHSPAWNMAADELLLAEAPRTGTVLLRLYRWNHPAVSIGLSQTYPANLSDRYTVVRRPTGGGVVFHDGDFTYTVVTPPDHGILRYNRMDSYLIFHEVLLKLLEKSGVHAALQAEETPDVDRLTMQCFRSPSRFDVVDGRGAKFAGAAQRRGRSGLLHQGSIRVDSAPPAKLEELRRNLPGSFTEAFGVTFAPYIPAADFAARAERLARDKYETDGWNREKNIL